MGELLRLTHHAEDRDPVDAGIDIEADQPLQARRIERTVVGEWRRRDDEHTLGGFVEQMSGHGFTSPRA